MAQPDDFEMDPTVTVWPVTGEAEWCGEHEVKPEITETIASLQDGSPEDGPAALQGDEAPETPPLAPDLDGGTL